MGKIQQKRLLRERAIGPLDMPSPSTASPAGARVVRPARSVTVNLAESPLGWLFSHGFVSRLQFDAGERLRTDWERSELAPHVTMAWDAAPIARGRGGASPGPELSACQLDARRRFDAAVASAGPGLSDILWRVVCAGEGMRDAETALGWPARAGKLVLTLALDRLANYYRMG